MNRYAHRAMILHWLIAFALAFQLALGWRLEDLPRGAGQFAAFQLHKSVGITILLLTLVRIAMRLMTPRPEPLGDSVWAKRLAGGVHGLLYLFMLGAPLTGWVLVSTAKIQLPTLLFGTLPWPHLPLGSGWQDPAEGAHALLAWVGVALFLLHVAGALRHQLLKGENLLGRMIPGLGAAPHIALNKGALAAGGALVLMALAGGAAWTMAFEAPPPSLTPTRIPDQTPALPTAEAVANEIVAANETAAPDNAAEAEESAPAAMPVSRWTVAKGGQLGFVASWTGTAVNGSFSDWDADIRFSPDDLPGSRIRVTVGLASADTKDAQRDEMLRGESFFNAGSMGRAVFTSRTITKTGKDRFRAAGTLSLHGKTRPVTLNFTLAITGDRAHANGGTTLDRTAFGVGSGEWAATTEIGADVTVRFDFEADRAKS